MVLGCLSNPLNHIRPPFTSGTRKAPTPPQCSINLFQLKFVFTSLRDNTFSMIKLVNYITQLVSVFSLLSVLNLQSRD